MLLKNTNRKPYTIYRMIPLSMTLSDLWPHFKVVKFFEDEYRKNEDKDKVTIAQLETICNMWNGNMFVDLDWPLNASSLLSASAELLVWIRDMIHITLESWSVFITPKYFFEIRPQLCELSWLQTWSIAQRSRWPSLATIPYIHKRLWLKRVSSQISVKLKFYCPRHNWGQ